MKEVQEKIDELDIQIKNLTKEITSKFEEKIIATTLVHLESTEF